MALPRKKKSYSKTHSRKSANMKLAVRSRASCSKCGAPRLPHRICPACGYYKDRQVLAVRTIEE